MLRRIVVWFVVISCSMLVLGGVAAAQGVEPPYPEQPPATVSPTSAAVTTTTAAVLSDRVTRQPAVLDQSVRRGSLPVTGGDILGLAVIGTAAIALGGALVLQRRRMR